MAINDIPPETLTEILRRTVNPPPDDLTFFDWPGAREVPLIALRTRHLQAVDAMLVSHLFQIIVSPLLREWVVLSNSDDAQYLLADKGLLRVVNTVFVKDPGPSWALLSKVLRAGHNITGFHAIEEVNGGLQLPNISNIAHLTAIPRLPCSLPGSWIGLGSLELLDYTYPLSYRPAVTLPCLVSLKIPIGDLTMMDCSMPALRNLCLVPTERRYEIYGTGRRATDFLIAHGAKLRQLEFTPFSVPQSVHNLSLDYLCPHLKELIIDAGARGIRWDHLLWRFTWYQGQPHHLKVVDIGLRGLAERVRWADAGSYIEELVDQARFPALKTVRDLAFRGTRDGPGWASIVAACAARGVILTDGAGNR